MKANDSVAEQIVELRLFIGLLGERDNAGWWASGFMSATSSAFLVPTFGSRILHARYQGVSEAARRVHDERIGVGRAFHVFRLPEAMEQQLFQVVQSDTRGFDNMDFSPNAARKALEKLAGKAAEAKSGPTLVGTPDALDRQEWVAEVACMYSDALKAGVQCFPYFSNAR